MRPHLKSLRTQLPGFETALTVAGGGLRPALPALWKTEETLVLRRLRAQPPPKAPPSQQTRFLKYATGVCRMNAIWEDLVVYLLFVCGLAAVVVAVW